MARTTTTSDPLLELPAGHIFTADHGDPRYVRMAERVFVEQVRPLLLEHELYGAQLEDLLALKLLAPDVSGDLVIVGYPEALSLVGDVVERVLTERLRR